MLKTNVRLSRERPFNMVDERAKKWPIIINANKTVAMTFTRRKKINLPPLKLNDADITYVTSHRYLRVDLQHRLNWRTHCVRIRGRATGALKTLSPLMKLGIPLSTKNVII